MKRGSLRRKSPLRRSGTSLTRKLGLMPATPLRQTAGKIRPPIPPKVRAEAYRRTKHRCIRCGAMANTLHHVLAVQRWPQFLAQSENLVPACWPCHDDHERANRRFCLDELPPIVREWALARQPDYVRGIYPPTA